MTMNTTFETMSHVKVQLWVVESNAAVQELLQHIAADRLDSPDAYDVDWLAGYGAYHRGLGPGRGRQRNLGWLAAAHDLAADLDEHRMSRGEWF
jgi:hypothetical protein